jgi:hypothetical protein
MAPSCLPKIPLLVALLLAFVAFLVRGAAATSATVPDKEEELGRWENQTYHVAACEEPLRLYNGNSMELREEAIRCAMGALDANADGAISGVEYYNYINTLIYIKRKFCPSWTWILSRCDCHGRGVLTPHDMRHASKTCLENAFWVNRVRGQTCGSSRGSQPVTAAP